MSNEDDVASFDVENTVPVSLSSNDNTEQIAIDDIDVATLTPITPTVMRNQATINIGTIGHVAHGKSTLVKAMSGVQTVRFKNELERNITIRLGYANAKLFKCDSPTCYRPGCYRSAGSDAPDLQPCPRQGCNGTLRLQRHVSFVDCPGHDVLMATMLNGAAVMDAALLLIAGNEPCPQPQTSEHLAAVEIMRLNHIVVAQNKVDLMQPDEVKAQHEQIRQFVQGTVAENAPVVPLSAQWGHNVDVLCEYLCTRVPLPVRNFDAPPRMIVVRSFDVNKPGTGARDLQGGVAGGTIMQGVLRVGDNIEVRPGIVRKDRATGALRCSPIKTRVVSLFAERNSLQFAVPGGLIGVGTLIDPTLCRADRLVGSILGPIGQLPDVYVEVEVHYFLLRRLLGVRVDSSDKKKARVQKLSRGEVLMVNIGSTSCGARLVAVKESASLAKMMLTQPVCTSIDERLAISRRIDKHWRLIGWAHITSGNPISLEDGDTY